MKYLYKLFTNAIKRLAAPILSFVAASFTTLIFMIPVIYFAAWLSTFFYDQRPPLSEASFLWPLIAFTVIGCIYVSDKIEEHLLQKFGLQGDNDHE